MDIFNPTLVGTISHKDSHSSDSKTVSLHVHENSATLASLGEDAEGRLTFNGQTVVSDVELVSFNLDGVITDTAAAMTIAMADMKLPKAFAGSRAVCLTPPASTVTVPFKVGTVVVGSVSIEAVTGNCTFVGASTDVSIAAGAILTLTFDSLANTGGGNVAVVLSFIKDAA